MGRDQGPYGVMGVFLTLLGAGVILDGDWWWPGSTLIVVGVACLVAAARDSRAE
jgi:hypothetical protein